MNLKLKVWRQPNCHTTGHWEEHEVNNLDPLMSVLELLDRLNEQLVTEGKEAVSFESDCREGICGACGLMVDNYAQGPKLNTPACHQRLYSFKNGSTVKLAPYGAGAYPVLRDLIVDRSNLDAVIRSGGFISSDAGTAPDAEALPVTHDTVENALDFAACIGCGACVAACPNGSAQLFVGAKLAHLSMLPLPSQERTKRGKSMVATADALFGPCSNYGECALACPAEIPLSATAAVNKERMRSGLKRQLFKQS